MAAVVFSVPDICCEHCERTVTRALAPLAGVQEVVVDIPAKRVRVTYDDRVVTTERMMEALRGEDYPAAPSGDS